MAGPISLQGSLDNNTVLELILHLYYAIIYLLYKMLEEKSCCKVVNTILFNTIYKSCSISRLSN